MSPGPSPAPQSQQVPSALSTKQKQKPFTIGIAAGAEDAKYQAKYKELKRKVKDIEADNDKLHFKVLQAKLSIRRMKMERAILYERLSVAPPSPSLADRLPLPPNYPLSGPPPLQPSSRPPPGPHQHREMRHHASSMDADHIHALQEHIRAQGHTRVVPGPDGRPVPVMDNSMGSAVAHSPHMSMHSPRRISGGHDAGHHPYPSMGPLPPVHPYENTRGHSNSNSHTSPPMHHPHASSSHTRNRSHSSSRSRSHHVPPQPYRSSGTGHHLPYPESLSASQQPLHSPPLSDRERSRRGDFHDYPGSHPDPHGYDRHQTHPQMSPRAHPAESRSSGRVHTHQRIGPGAYVNREEQYDRHRDLDRERERDWERERERERPRDYGRGSREMIPSNLQSPHSVPRPRPPPLDREYDHHASSRPREEQPYYQDIHAPSSFPAPAPHPSRSGTPGSGSASGSGAGVAEVPSRPDSRTQQYYEHDRARGAAYRLHPVSQPNEDGDFGHEDSRSQTHADGGAVGAASGGGNFPIPEQNLPVLESRKRSRNEMDESDNDVGDGTGGGAMYASGAMQDDRGSKRYQRDQPLRSADNSHEDTRMGS